MKKFFNIFFMLFIALSIFAQEYVITFMGIPVDGTKAQVKAKLIAKGFNLIKVCN